MEERKEAGLGGGISGTVIQEQASADYTQSPEDKMALQSPHHYGGIGHDLKPISLGNRS